MGKALGLRPRGRPPGRSRVLTPAQELDALERWLNGERQDDIAEDMRVGQSRLSEIIQKRLSEMTLETGDDIIRMFWEQQRVSIATAMNDLESPSAVVRSRARRDLNQSQERICKMLGLDRPTSFRVSDGEVRYVIQGIPDDEIHKELR